MMAMAVSPMARPIGIRRRTAAVTVWRTGESGCSSRAANRQADTMNRPSPPASIRYSGQWSRRTVFTGGSPWPSPPPAGPPRARRSGRGSHVPSTPTLLQELRDQSRPPGLVARADPRAVVHPEDVRLVPMMARERPDAVRREELRLVQHVPEHLREPLTADQGQEAPGASVGGLLKLDVIAEVRAILDEPLHPPLEPRETLQ